MQLIKNVRYPFKSLTPPDELHYFFGYYDLQPYGRGGTCHLCHRVPFMNRLPEADDFAEIGYIETDTLKFRCVARTRAWNFQQGAMLSWYDDHRIIYNIRDNDAYLSVITDLDSGHTERVGPALAAVNTRSGYGLALNFSRIYDFRPGYGYAGIPDPYAGENAPDDDGVFLVNLNTHESRQIISYRRLAAMIPDDCAADQYKLVVNHITFNPSGNRFIFLLRNFTTPDTPWRTMLLSSDLNGCVEAVTGFCFHSHYHWKNDRQLLIESDYLGRRGLHLFTDADGRADFIDIPGLNETDIHCLYTPDRKLILGDTYPNADQYRPLYLYDTVRKSASVLAEVYSHPVANGDYRCDLHARWSPDGNLISFDTTHNGRREIYEMAYEK